MMTKWENKSVKDFALLLYQILKSDRDVFLGVAGDTGGGKSTFMILLTRAYEKIAKVDWNFKYMTYKRQELIDWIDGKGEEKKGRVPEYTPIIADELVSMFFNRNWQEAQQIEAIELFNKCRDRHLLIMGAVPIFWQLDKALLPRFRFYVYVPLGRNVAWVFKKNDNPFARDQWGSTKCAPHMDKRQSPHGLPNFLYEIKFGDLTEEDKRVYLEIRNTRRIGTEGQREEKRPDFYRKIKKQRDAAMKILYYDHLSHMPTPEFAEKLGMLPDTVRKILKGEM